MRRRVAPNVSTCAIPGTKIPVLRLLGLVVSIGLADSLNPSTIGPAMYFSTGPHPRRRVLQFTAGVVVVFFLGGAVLTIGPGQALLRLIPHPGPTVTYVAETVVGVAMLIASVVLWRLRRRPGHRKSSDSSESRSRARSPFVLGVTIAAVELLTAFPYFAAIGAIIAAGLNVFDELILLAAYDLCFVLPLLAIVATLTVAGDRAQEVLARARAYLDAHWRVLLAGAFLVAGTFVTVLGVTGLTSRVHGTVGRYSRRLRRTIKHP